MAQEAARNDNERLERAEGYLAAAREHYAFLNRESVESDEPLSYPLSYYVAGLAVECLFRAYGELVGSKHDAKHDLRRMAEAGRFTEFMLEGDSEPIAEALTSVMKRWLNNHRYKSRNALQRFLNDAELYRTDEGKYLKGNSDAVLRYNWERLSKMTAFLLDRGIERWEISKQKWNRQLHNPSPTHEPN